MFPRCRYLLVRLGRYGTVVSGRVTAFVGRVGSGNLDPRATLVWTVTIVILRLIKDGNFNFKKLLGLWKMQAKIWPRKLGRFICDCWHSASYKTCIQLQPVSTSENRLMLLVLLLLLRLLECTLHGGPEKKPVSVYLPVSNSLIAWSISVILYWCNRK